MSRLGLLIRREATLAWGRGGGPLVAVGFYAGVATFLPLAIGPEPSRLASIAPGAAWVALALASLLSLERMFERDYEDGALDLVPLLDLEVRRLSAGQRRRLALARMLAAPRPLWLLDEPLSPLDAGWRTRFGAMMQTHLAGGGMILAAVHDPLPIPALSLEIAG